MKKTLTVLLIVALALTMFVSCSKKATVEEAKVATKVGMVVINDENDQGYTYNFMRGMNAAIEKLAAEGIAIDLHVVRNVNEDAGCKDANLELAADGCGIIFNNSYGFEPFMLQAAQEFPNVEFVGLTNCGSQLDASAKTHNAFAAIYEGRYVAGIAAGMKLQEMIDNKQITADKAVLGYVGAYSFAEVISGMSGFYLGAKSVCPSVTMLVQFVGSWGDPTLEAEAAQALIDQGALVISQHSDNTTPATTAQKNGVFHVGYNNDMTGVAPNASLLSSRIDWTRYFYTTLKLYVEGKEIPSDWTGTFAEGDVEVTPLNTKIAAKGTQEALDKAVAAFKAGTLNVFEIDNFTVNGGQKLTSCFAVDTNGDFAADSGEAVWDGVFHESYPEFQSAPYLTAVIDGITWLNAAY